MLAVCYGGYALVLGFADLWGVWVSVGLLSVILALHSSLQHEILHGHPFRSKALNEALVFPAIGLAIPFQRFRDLHLQHHHDPSLTDPYDDPESNYMDPGVWAQTPAVIRALYRFNNVLLGRMVVGPILSVLGLYAADIRAMFRGETLVLRAYLLHGLGLVPVIWAVSLSSLSFGAYVGAAYLAMSWLKIRTFLEHRAHEKVPGRTVIVESRGPLSILFLNNNFHSVHHAHPCVPWYQLPGFYAARRTQFLERNQAYHYRSYAEVFRQYFLRAKDTVPHPLLQQATEKPKRELEH
jgi:fatty acid desaturase